MQFGPFELVRRLGHGGMAETFEAIRHGASGVTQRVCIKRILPALLQQLADDPTRAPQPQPSLQPLERLPPPLPRNPRELRFSRMQTRV